MKINKACDRLNLCEESGENMVAETIKKVQEAEGKADSIAKDCRQQCTDMVDQAKKDALQLKEARLQEAKEKAGAAMEASKKEAEKFMESVDADIQKEIAALKTLAAGKEAQATEAVIKALF